MGSGMRYSEEEGRALLERLGRFKKNPTAPADASPAAAPAKKRGGRPKSGPSELELIFAKQVTDTHLPAPQREFKFHEERGWRFDYAWPDRKLAVEVQGMPHRIRERFLADVEKLAMAQIYGWRVLLVAGQDVRSGRAVSWLVTLWEMSK